MKLKGSEILIRELVRHGTDTVFGYPGNSVLSLYDALRDHGEIRHFLPADERGAVFMAEGYARATGKAGVCIATSGPGATNLVTGIADAFSDSIPLVAITGNAPLEMLGHDGFQEVDTTGITMPITKYNYIVKDVSALSETVSEAFHIALSGRRGPVLIDVPSNVFDEYAEYETKDFPEKKLSFDPAELEAAIETVNSSERPLIYAGGGVIAAKASAYVAELSEKLCAPVGVSLKGIGAIDADDERYIGPGTHANEVAKRALREADLLISIGARFSSKATEKSPYSKNLRLLHLDIDASEIDKIHFADARLVGDVAITLPALTKGVDKRNNDWFNNSERFENATSSIPFQYIKCLNRRFGNRQLVTTDVGQHQLWVANYYDFSAPERFLSSCGLGAMGFGIGAAAGAAIATGERVLYVTGDGSFNMCFNELATIVKYNLPVTIVIMNNSSLGMIREVQKRYYRGRYTDSDVFSPDYVVLARSFGIDDAFVVKNPKELERLIFSENFGKTIGSTRPVLIDCRTGKNQKIL